MALLCSLRHAIGTRIAKFVNNGSTSGSHFSTTSPPVITQARENIFFIAINRPEKRNCVNSETATGLVNALREFDERKDVAVGIVHGIGGNFCAGYDLSEISSAAQQNPQLDTLLHPAPMGPTHMLTKKPLIAAVDGYAVAGGLELALLCDLRIVEENAVLGVFCRRFGVPLIDGGTVRLPAIVGLGRALDLILTGRPVSGKEAREMGLATQVVAVGTSLGEAVTLATCIAKFPQKCVQADKSSAYHSVFDVKSLRHALEFEYENSKGVILEEGIVGAENFTLRGLGRHGKANVNAWPDSRAQKTQPSTLLD